MRCTEFSKRNWLPRERLQVRTQICGGRPEIACQNCRRPPESEIPRFLVTGEGKVCEALPQRHLSTKTPTLYLQSIPIGEKFYLAENFYWSGHLFLADLLVFLLFCRSLKQKWSVIFHWHVFENKCEQSRMLSQCDLLQSTMFYVTFPISCECKHYWVCIDTVQL